MLKDLLIIMAIGGPIVLTIAAIDLPPRQKGPPPEIRQMAIDKLMNENARLKSEALALKLQIAEHEAMQPYAAILLDSARVTRSRHNETAPAKSPDN